jgi:hypothetical protein
MENPFEIILEKLNNIERAIEELNAQPASIEDSNEDMLLSRAETAELLKIKFTTLWKHTKSGRLTCYGIGNKVYYKKNEVLKDQSQNLWSDEN